MAVGRIILACIRETPFSSLCIGAMLFFPFVVWCAMMAFAIPSSTSPYPGYSYPCYNSFKQSKMLPSYISCPLCRLNCHPSPKRERHGDDKRQKRRQVTSSHARHAAKTTQTRQRRRGRGANNNRAARFADTGRFRGGFTTPRVDTAQEDNVLLLGPDSPP